ncbi:uncharacterized protein PRCAT00004205001 [Priceomyces carsonii]|uniref:uncharacterized protein n=1 Tax=Priceomyces carsonii TaxID=28549 RepID=UPI002EDBB2B5|nr:unnamed protein product [Priceomyces carsonii]
MLVFEYIAPWVPIFRNSLEAELAANSNKPLFTSFQLATVDFHGLPRNRTLVYRGFLFEQENTNVITFTTDKRMKKYEELLNNDRYEAVFYFLNLKYQFRFRGRARMIDAKNRPVISLLKVDPGFLGGKKKPLSQEDILLSSEGHLPQSVPINTALVSPKIEKNLQKLEQDFMSSPHLFPPTQEDWNHEVHRQWDNLSKNLKKSFKKPPPKAPLNDEYIKTMDAIRRGVDGKKDDEGFKNFSVVAMFSDYVDFVDLERDRRIIYQLDEYGQWAETEVCP